jgi:predicted ATPase/class 3 adenylate cyclase
VDAQSAITTFLFTDIEGSSLLWEQEPERMRPALARHDAIVRSAIEGHGGTVVKMTGDGVCAAFSDPLDAVSAVLELQQKLHDPATTKAIGLKVRSGLHVGVVERRDGDYFGNPINRASRIMNAAHGGQMLVSQAVVDLVRDRLPGEVTLRDLGSVRLRDLASPERIYQLLHPALPPDFPALRSLAATPNNLPQQVTSFVGRQRELAEITKLLGSSRLLSLCGAGGIGKTRLSLQLAANVLDDYPDGVWLVELAPLTDARLVVQAVASVVGVKEEAGRPVAEALIKYVADLQMLLILDNCEHLLDPCAELADQLLRSGRQLRIVASSRERLHVDGESVYPVPALAVPDDPTPIEAEALGQFESIRLFVDRATAATPSFKLTPHNSAAVISICRQLDGIPLAIELAAARTRALSVENIASRLSDRFRLLTTGNRTALPRQQTLRALIDWSYELLSEQERTLFRSLAVFAGGWTLEAAEAVCGGGAVEAADVLDLLTALVEKSLVTVDAERDRYGLLETMRQYALERLDESGEGDAVRSRHLDFYLAFAEQARPALVGPEQGEWLARLDLERENLLGAHRWCDRAANGAEAGLRLVHAVKPYWAIRGLLGLGYRVTVEALDRCDPQQRSVTLSQGLFNAGQLASWMGHYADAQGYLERSLEIARALGDKGRIARVLQPLGAVSLGQQNLAQARRHLEEALSLAEELGDQRELAAAINALAQLKRTEGDLDAAEPLYEKVLELGRALEDKQTVAIGLLNLAMVAIARGDAGRAAQMLLHVLVIADEIGSKPAGQSVLEVSAGLACLLQSWTVAARFYGMAEAQAGYTGIRRDAADEAFLRPQVGKARAALGTQPFATEEAAGRAVVYEDALAEAKSWLATAAMTRASRS